MSRTRFVFNPVHREKRLKGNIPKCLNNCVRIGLCKFFFSHINFIMKIRLPNNPVCSLAQLIELMSPNISKAAGSLERGTMIYKYKISLHVSFGSSFSKIIYLHKAIFWGKVNPVKYVHLRNHTTRPVYLCSHN